MAGKPRLAVCISYFNSVKELPRLLDPLVDHVDMIIGIDGRYPGFSWPSNISEDGSNELLTSKYGAFVEINKDPIQQIDKRNQYLEIADKAGMDFVLVLDTDDYLSRKKKYQNWDLFYDELAKMPDYENLANIWFWMSPLWRKNWNMVTDNTWSRYTRIIRPDKIRYEISHWTYVSKDNPNTFDMANIDIEGLRFNSNSTLRNEKYMKSGYDWAEKQMLEENKRFETPRAKRMKFNFWCRQIQKALMVEGTEIIEGEEEVEKIKKALQNP